jgi:transcriptional regulator with XRE-family HTH domain
MKIGTKIRSYRKEKGLTLEELSEKSGVALATLSRMETGKMPGTVKSHSSICKALGISIADLYREIEDSSKNIEIVSDEKKPEHLEGSGKVRFELLVAKTSGKKMLPMIVRIAPGSATHPERNKPGTEKFLYSLKGNTEVNISGKAYPLRKGDSLYFESSLKHFLKNTSNSEAILISITSATK